METISQKESINLIEFTVSEYHPHQFLITCPFFEISLLKNKNSSRPVGLGSSEDVLLPGWLVPRVPVPNKLDSFSM